MTLSDDADVMLCIVQEDLGKGGASLGITSYLLDRPTCLQASFHFGWLYTNQNGCTLEAEVIVTPRVLAAAQAHSHMIQDDVKKGQLQTKHL